MKSINQQKTARRIKQLMQDRDIKTNALACEMVLNPQSVYKWTAGKCLPTIDNFVQLADIFEVGIDDILVIEVV